MPPSVIGEDGTERRGGGREEDESRKSLLGSNRGRQREARNTATTTTGGDSVDPPNYGSIEEATDSTPLIQNQSNNHRSCQTILTDISLSMWTCINSCKWVILVLLLLGLGSGAFWTWFLRYRPGGSDNPTQLVNLKVVSLNLWALPVGTNGCRDKDIRIQTAMHVVLEEEYDLFLIQGLWMEPDHTALANVSKLKNYYMTEFRDLASSFCDGRALRSWCSGLAVISKFPFKEKYFESFEYKGNALKDKEWSLAKGVGKVNIQIQNLSVDAFVSHTHDTDPWYQNEQAQEIYKKFLRLSSADIIIFGGDLNSVPNSAAYNAIASQGFTNVAQSADSVHWLDLSMYSTLNHKQNVYTAPKAKPLIVDYLFFKEQSRLDQKVEITNFNLGYFRNKTGGDLSNHQALIGKFQIDLLNVH